LGGSCRLEGRLREFISGFNILNNDKDRTRPDFIDAAARLRRDKAGRLDAEFDVRAATGQKLAVLHRDECEDEKRSQGTLADNVHFFQRCSPAAGGSGWLDLL
jgi:hypothetical protein